MKQVIVDMLKWLQVVLVSCATLWIPTSAHAESPDDILIVANLSVKADSINIQELRGFYLKKKTNWRFGEKVIPIHAQEGSTIRKDFVKRLLDMSPAEEKKFWNRYRIRTGLTEPVEFYSVLKAVFKMHGAIGYVYRSNYREGVVKTLLVLPAEPAE